MLQFSLIDVPTFCWDRMDGFVQHWSPSTGFFCAIRKWRLKTLTPTEFRLNPEAPTFIPTGFSMNSEAPTFIPAISEVEAPALYPFGGIWSASAPTESNWP